MWQHMFTKPGDYFVFNLPKIRPDIYSLHLINDTQVIHALLFKLFT